MSDLKAVMVELAAHVAEALTVQGRPSPTRITYAVGRRPEQVGCCGEGVDRGKGVLSVWAGRVFPTVNFPLPMAVDLTALAQEHAERSMVRLACQFAVALHRCVPSDRLAGPTADVENACDDLAAVALGIEAARTVWRGQTITRDSAPGQDGTGIEGPDGGCLIVEGFVVAQVCLPAS